MSDAVGDRKSVPPAGGAGARLSDAESPMRGIARLVRAVILLAGAVAAALVVGFIAFAAGIAGAAPPDDPRAEGIVVLTGGSARIDSALHLLAEHRASRLLISGVNPAVGAEALAGTVDGNLEAMLACCVDLGHAARDTIGNATETRDWAHNLGYGSLIVVTSAYHMPRSLAELAGAMPGVALIAYPIANPELHLSRWWSYPQSVELLVREYGKYLLTAARLVIAPQAPATAAPAG
jgi:uncharacterized SAM-binding protein YcdF (DUF218 family)